MAIAGGVLLGVGACSAPAEHSVRTETDNQSPTRSVRTYTDTLALPLGTVLPVECQAFADSMNGPFCQATFPNGTKVANSGGLVWSPDGHYGINCRDMTHDSPCGFFEVWDLDNGKLVAELRFNDWHRWFGDDGHILAVIRDPVYSDIKPLMTLWNVAENTEKAPSSCKDWLSPDEDAWALQICQQSLSDGIEP